MPEIRGGSSFIDSLYSSNGTSIMEVLANWDVESAYFDSEAHKAAYKTRLKCKDLTDTVDVMPGMMTAGVKALTLVKAAGGDQQSVDETKAASMKMVKLFTDTVGKICDQ